MHIEEGKLHAHPSPSVLHDTRICEGSPVRARWTCKAMDTHNLVGIPAKQGAAPQQFTFEWHGSAQAAAVVLHD